MGSLWDPFLTTSALVRDDFCPPGSAVPRLGLYNTIEEEGWGTTTYTPSFEHCTGPPLPNGAGPRMSTGANAPLWICAEASAQAAAQAAGLGEQQAVDLHRPDRPN